MRNFLAALVFVIAIVGGFIRAVAGPPPVIWMKAPGLAGFAPAKVHVELHVSPVASDNAIAVTLLSADWATSRQWDGDGIPVTKFYSWDFTDVPEGTYELKAVIGRKDTVRAIDVRTVIVPGRGR